MLRACAADDTASMRPLQDRVHHRVRIHTTPGRHADSRDKDLISSLRTTYMRSTLERMPLGDQDVSALLAELSEHLDEGLRADKLALSRDVTNYQRDVLRDLGAIHCIEDESGDFIYYLQPGGVQYGISRMITQSMWNSSSYSDGQPDQMASPYPARSDMEDIKHVIVSQIIGVCFDSKRIIFDELGRVGERL